MVLSACLFSGARLSHALENFEYGWLNTDGLRGFDDDVRSSILWDRDGPGGEDPVLVVGGRFTVAGKTLANRVALWNGSGWEALGDGFSGEVDCFAILPNNDLVAGGNFQRVGDSLIVNGVARWDGQAWHPLDTGFASVTFVNALAVLPNGDLVATGGNMRINNVEIKGIARWNGTSWAQMGAGLGGNAAGYALAVLPNGDLVVGGNFNAVDNVLANNIARYDGETWHPMADGVNGQIYAMAVYPDGNLAVAGAFSILGGVSAFNVGIWDGSGWNGVGPTVLGNYPSATVFAITILQDQSLVVGGSFWSDSNSPGDFVAHWNGTSWTAMGTGMNNYVFTLQTLSNGDVVAGGRFLYADGIHASGIARWDGDNWNFFGSGFGGTVSGSIVKDAIYDFLTLPDERVVAGGAFTAAGSVTANAVAVYDGSSWAPIGDGLPDDVYALARLPNGNILAGGTFKKAGGDDATGLAVWNGATWAPFGDPIDGVSNAIVRSILVHSNGDVIVGGQFYLATSEGSGTNIVRWNGEAWQGMGPGLNGAVHELIELADGSIVAGGEFSRSGTEDRLRIARWDGTVWQPLGTGMNGNVYDLDLMPNGDVIAVGRFTTSGGLVTRGTAIWNGTEWAALSPSGITTLLTGIHSVSVLPDGNVIIGGFFNVQGTNPATTNFALWNGESWSSLGSGADLGTQDGVFALEPYADGGFLVGGGFLTMNGQVNAHFARWGTVGDPTMLPVKLWVDYTDPGWTVFFEADEAQTYCIEYSDTIGNWQPILLNQQGNTEYTETDPGRLALDRIFYRARGD